MERHHIYSILQSYCPPQMTHMIERSLDIFHACLQKYPTCLIDQTLKIQGSVINVFGSLAKKNLRPSYKNHHMFIRGSSIG